MRFRPLVPVQQLIPRVSFGPPQVSGETAEVDPARYHQ